MSHQQLFVISSIVFGVAFGLGDVTAQDGADQDKTAISHYERLSRMVRLAHTEALPSVDRVEVFSLAFATGKREPAKTDSESFQVRPALPSAGNDPLILPSPEILAGIIASKVLTGKSAEKIADDWRSLQFKPNSTFCHVPAYGLRFFREERLLLSVAVCWKCQNFYLPSVDPSTGRAGVVLYGFDDNAASKKLLNELRRFLPHPQIKYPRLR